MVHLRMWGRYPIRCGRGLVLFKFSFFILVFLMNWALEVGSERQDRFYHSVACCLPPPLFFFLNRDCRRCWVSIGSKKTTCTENTSGIRSFI